MGSAVGGVIAPGVIGTNVGGLLGAGAGAVIDRITGQGDYTIKSNTLIKAAPVPSFGKGCIRVQHREMLYDVTSSGVFKLSPFDINPGLRTSFPWLAQIAQNFEMYKFHGLIFEYVSTSGDALTGTNTALGKVIMATDYNVLDDNFDNEQQMYTTEFSNSGKPATNLIHAVECAPPENPLKLYYIRTGATTTGDQRFYDLGRFQIAVSGCQSVGNPIGELWVSYDVSLCKPSIQSVDDGDDLLSGHARLTSYSAGVGPFLANNNLLVQSGSNISVANTTTNVVNFDVKVTTQRFLIEFQWNVTAAVAAPDLASGFNIVNGAIDAFWQNTVIGFFQVPLAGVSTVRYGCQMVVRANAPGDAIMSISFNNGATYGTINAFDLFITQIPDNIV